MSVMKNALNKLAALGKEKHVALEHVVPTNGMHFWKDLPEAIVEQLIDESESESSKVLAKNLSYPIQMTYDFGDDKDPRYTILTLRSIRKKGNIYTYRAVCSETDFTYNFNSICIANMTEGTDSNPVADHTDFAEKFSFSLLPEYTRLLHALHTLIYIGLADGNICENESAIIKSFITTTLQTEHRQYLPDLINYAMNCNIQYPIFAEALQIVESEYTEAELIHFFNYLKQLVESDKKITQQEREFFTSMGDKLGVWV